MPQQRRRAQHRTEREPTKVKEISELRTENKQLKKRVAQLRKEIERLEVSPDVDSDTYSVDTYEVEEEAKTGMSCPKCGSNEIGMYNTPGGKKLLGCRACKKWRGSL